MAGLLTTFGTLALLASGPMRHAAHANIVGFQLNGIEGNDGLALYSALGTTSGATTHSVNINECIAYQGGSVTVSIDLDADTYAGYTYGVAIALPGATCPTTDPSFATATAGSCIPLIVDEDVTTTFSVIVDLDDITGGDCAANTHSDAILYTVLKDVAGTTDVSEQIKFDVDLNRPEPPTIISATPGDARIEVDWEDTFNDTETAVTYAIYWDAASVTDIDAATVSYQANLTATSYAIEEDVDNGVTYYIRASTTDDAGNESELSDEFTASPVPTTDFWERYQAQGGTDPGGHCFIATAAFGTPMAHELVGLRWLRDSVLAHTEAGRMFITHYYGWGSRLALYIEDKPTLRAVTRLILTPLVLFSDLGRRHGLGLALVALLSVIGLIMGSLRWVVCLWRRRQWEVSA